MPDLALDIIPERPDDAAAIDRLHDRAFGPGRFARTAFRLREGVAPRLDLSFVARIGSMLVGSNRMTPIRIGAVEAMLLGPLTVEPAFGSRGIGTALVNASLEAARAAGVGLVLLVGDEPFYARMGFRRVPEGRVSLPGPVDPARILWCELVPGATAAAAGAVRGG